MPPGMSLLFLPASLLVGSLLWALLIDRLFGEPPTRIHPVVAMGNYLNWAAPRFVPVAESISPDADADAVSPQRLRRLGAWYWAGGAAAVLLLAVLLQMACVWLVQRYGLWLAAPLLALALKPLFAWRMLAAEVQAVESALAQSLAAGRARLAYLVSRDTRTLSEAQVREAAIETLAENFNDSFIAPLFWFCIGGLPAAALYRYANTADASWGYIGARHGRNWTDAGRFAARTDDALSWLPARLTAALFLIAAQAGFTRKNTKNTLKNLGLEAGKTPSPNSGWPMAAMALLLQLRLGKADVYQLNPQGDLPQAPHVRAALRLCRHTWLNIIWLLAAAGVFLLAVERGFFYT